MTVQHVLISRRLSLEDRRLDWTVYFQHHSRRLVAGLSNFFRGCALLPSESRSPMQVRCWGASHHMRYEWLRLGGWAALHRFCRLERRSVRAREAGGRPWPVPFRAPGPRRAWSILTQLNQYFESSLQSWQLGLFLDVQPIVRERIVQSSSRNRELIDFCALTRRLKIRIYVAHIVRREWFDGLVRYLGHWAYLRQPQESGPERVGQRNFLVGEAAQPQQHGLKNTTALGLHGDLQLIHINIQSFHWCINETQRAFDILDELLVKYSVSLFQIGRFPNIYMTVNNSLLAADVRINKVSLWLGAHEWKRLLSLLVKPNAIYQSDFRFVLPVESSQILLNIVLYHIVLEDAHIIRFVNIK